MRSAALRFVLAAWLLMDLHLLVLGLVLADAVVATKASAGGYGSNSALISIAAVGITPFFIAAFYAVAAADRARRPIMAYGLLATMATAGAVILVRGLTARDRYSNAAMADKRLGIGVLILVVLLSFTITRIGRAARPKPAGAVQIGPRQAPDLWRTLQELAEALGTTAPHQVWLTDTPNAAVTEELLPRGLFRGWTRRLYIGAPLISALRTSELRAVLAHELAHYACNHTRWAVMAYRHSPSIRPAYARCHAPALAPSAAPGDSHGRMHRLLTAYNTAYDRVSLPMNRQQELEADALAAASVGPEVFGAGLCAVYAAAARWNTFTPPVQKPKPLWENIFNAFHLWIEGPDGQRQFTQLMRGAPRIPAPSGEDTHPGLRERLDMLGVGDPDPALRDPEPAMACLGRNWDGLFSDLVVSAYRPDIGSVDVRVTQILVASLGFALVTIGVLPAPGPATGGPSMSPTFGFPSIPGRFSGFPSMPALVPPLPSRLGTEPWANLHLPVVTESRLPLVPTAAGVLVHVRSGDTLSAIAVRCHTTVDALEKANQLSSSLIRAGSDLTVPVAGPGPSTCH
ncbi:hypothetical protein GCM10009839_02520 [Catenulispora yoronensis]|uniref:LysM domain-containing protein n=1 Tax=Catenulispora yoronensis TaxID=450799 RepID=A0ABN2TK82_9ACTN